jgi:hypothetical protein
VGVYNVCIHMFLLVVIIQIFAQALLTVACGQC